MSFHNGLITDNLSQYEAKQNGKFMSSIAFSNTGHWTE